MNELQKYQLINSCESVSDLKAATYSIGDIIISSGKNWTPKLMCEYIDGIVRGDFEYNMATRKYGIRQQLMYLIYYGKTN